MTSHSVPNNPNKNSTPYPSNAYGDTNLRIFFGRLTQRLERDALIQQTTDELRTILQVDRVVLYYFYSQWKGQVTFESLRSRELSIIGETGANDCFNDDYAALYLAGRVRAIPDIELESIHECHRNFLRSIGVRANLVVPVLNAQGLWGLLVAHHCQNARYWLPSEIEVMKKAAKTLSTAPAIRES